MPDRPDDDRPAPSMDDFSLVDPMADPAAIPPPLPPAPPPPASGTDLALTETAPASGVDESLGRDEITGGPVPKADMVFFRGYWVGEEGKNILLQRLARGEESAGVNTRPSFWQRLGGAILDNIAVSLATSLFGAMALAGMVAGGLASAGGEGLPGLFRVLGNTHAPGYNVINIGGSLLVLAYFTWMVLSFKGKTLGKMAARTQVVRMDGKPVTFSCALRRALGYRGPDLLLALAMAALAFVDLPETTFVGVFVAMAAATQIYALVNVIFLLADTRENRALHDRIAGTRVIRAQAPITQILPAA